MVFYGKYLTGTGGATVQFINRKGPILCSVVFIEDSLLWRGSSAVTTFLNLIRNVFKLH